MSKKLVGSVVGVVTTFGWVFIENGTTVLGMLTVFQSHLAPRIQSVDQSTVQTAVVAFATLWVSYGAYRILKKGLERLQ